MILPLLFFLVAVVYSSAGLGGGSSYVALLVLSGVPRETLPPIALGCNIIVALESFVQFRQAGHFRWKLFWPFALSSLPMAYVGGRLHLPDTAFQVALAAALALVAVRLLFWKTAGAPEDRPQGKDERRPRWQRQGFLVLVGAILGLAAGVTGIGGGIYLIPALLLLKMATPKEAAASAGLFIVVNSASGLAGQLSRAPMDWQAFFPLAAAVFAGGLVGSRTGARRFKGETIQRIAGLLILAAVARLLWNLAEPLVK